MPGLRTLGLAGAIGIVLAAYLVAWLHLVPVLAVGAGAIAGVAILLVAAGMGEDATRAEEAWRQAAGLPAGRTPGTPGPHEPTSWPEPSGPATNRGPAETGEPRGA